MAVDQSAKGTSSPWTPPQRATRIWEQLLAEYEPPPLAAGVEEALDAFVGRRKREIARAGG